MNLQTVAWFRISRGLVQLSPRVLSPQYFRSFSLLGFHYSPDCQDLLCPLGCRGLFDNENSGQVFVGAQAARPKGIPTYLLRPGAYVRISKQLYKPLASSDSRVRTPR